MLHISGLLCTLHSPHNLAQVDPLPSCHLYQTKTIVVVIALSPFHYYQSQYQLGQRGY